MQSNGWGYKDLLLFKLLYLAECGYFWVDSAKYNFDDK
jgi:hypothetical protein